MDHAIADRDTLVSDSIAETQLLKPSDSERNAIKNQCNAVLEKRKMISDHKEASKPMREAVKNAKKTLLEKMKSHDDRTISLSKTKLKELEEKCAAEGLESLAPQLRLVIANKDTPLKASMIEEAIADITPEDIDEIKNLDAEKDLSRSFRDILHDAVLLKVKHMVRGVSESIRLSRSLERGKKYHDVPEMDAQADLMYEWHTNEQRLKRAKELQADAVKNLSETIKGLEKEVESFFERTQTTSQKLSLENRPYRLMRKVSRTKTRVGLTTVGPWIQDALSNMKIDTFRQFQKNSKDLIRDLTERLETQPVTTKTSVSLVSMKPAAEAAE